MFLLQEVNPLEVVGTIQGENPLAWVVSVLCLLALAFITRLYLQEKVEHNSTKDAYMNFAKEQIGTLTGLSNSVVNSFDKIWDILKALDSKSISSETTMNELKNSMHQAISQLNEIRDRFNRLNP